MNVTINNGFGTKNLNNNQHSWTNVRSDTYYKCPFCRFVIKRFYRNVNHSSMYYGNRIVSFNMIEDIPVYHRYLGRRYRYIIRSLYLL